MNPARNALGQPIGSPLPGWTPRARPPRTTIEGRHVTLPPLDPERHATALHTANAADGEGRMWTYMAYGPFADEAAYRGWLAAAAASDDPLFHAIVERGGVPSGVASYLRVEPAAGTIEIGHIALAPRLQRTRGATETLFLLMRRAFDELRYRRVEWKCDALNAPSRRAAERLGFRFEGVFRQATVYKERNRDTAWYAAIDGEWPALRSAFERWLDPANFDREGRQRTPLDTTGGGTP